MAHELEAWLLALRDTIGGECAGTITFLPKDANPQIARAGEVLWLHDQRLAVILDELPRRPMLAGQNGLPCHSQV